MLYICSLVKFRVKTEIWYDLKAWLYASGKPEIAQIQSVYRKVSCKLQVHNKRSLEVSGDL